MSESQYFQELKQELIKLLCQKNSEGQISYNKKEIEQIVRAYEFAFDKHKDMKRKSGEPYIIHPVAVAKILIELRSDATGIVAGLLHDVVEDAEDVTIDDIANLFHWRVANIVDGVTKIKKASVGINELNYPTIRKLLVSATSDIRIILVKLADRLHNMRTLEHMPYEKQEKIARETLEVYVPLAKTIGAFRIKKELEDWAIRYLDPEKYMKLENEIDAIIEHDYQNSLENTRFHLGEIFLDNEIDANVQYRRENTGSIYLKLKQDPIIDRIENLVSLKILLKDIKDCYTALGLINMNYKAEAIVKDYITNPKPNGYKSLHTRIFLPTPTLVKIRTEEQDKIATYGLTGDMYQMDDLFRVINCLKESNVNDDEFWKALQDQMIEQKIYVYAENGEIMEIQKGSSIVDFAYKLHTDIGNSLSHAYVNGDLKTIDYLLKTFDHVVVKTSSNKLVPNLEWLNYAATPYARSRILKANRID